MDEKNNVLNKKAKKLVKEIIDYENNADSNENDTNNKNLSNSILLLKDVLVELSKSKSSDKDDLMLVISCIKKVLSYVFYSLPMEPVARLTSLKICFRQIEDATLSYLKIQEITILFITEVVFEILINHITKMFDVKELLRLYISLLKDIQVSKIKFQKEKLGFYLGRLLDFLPMADIELQYFIVDIVYRFCDTKQRLKCLDYAGFTNEQKIEFIKINRSNFFSELRDFLMYYNECFGYNISYKCSNVYFDDHNLSPPSMHKLDQIWIDFSIIEQTLTIFFDGGNKCETITIFLSSVKDASLKRYINKKTGHEECQGIITLTRPCILGISLDSPLLKCRRLEFTSEEAKKINVLFSKYLEPIIKYLNMDNKKGSKLGFNSVVRDKHYKPLNISTSVQSPVISTGNLTFHQSVLNASVKTSNNGIKKTNSDKSSNNKSIRISSSKETHKEGAKGYQLLQDKLCSSMFKNTSTKHLKNAVSKYSQENKCKDSQESNLFRSLRSSIFYEFLDPKIVKKYEINPSNKTSSDEVIEDEQFETAKESNEVIINSQSTKITTENSYKSAENDSSQRTTHTNISCLSLKPGLQLNMPKFTKQRGKLNLSQKCTGLSRLGFKKEISQENHQITETNTESSLPKSLSISESCDNQAKLNKEKSYIGVFQDFILKQSQSKELSNNEETNDPNSCLSPLKEIVLKQNKELVSQKEFSNRQSSNNSDSVSFDIIDLNSFENSLKEMNEIMNENEEPSTKRVISKTNSLENIESDKKNYANSDASSIKENDKNVKQNEELLSKKIISKKQLSNFSNTVSFEKNDSDFAESSLQVIDEIIEQNEKQFNKIDDIKENKGLLIKKIFSQTPLLKSFESDATIDPNLLKEIDKNTENSLEEPLIINYSRNLRNNENTSFINETPTYKNDKSVTEKKVDDLELTMNKIFNSDLNSDKNVSAFDLSAKIESPTKTPILDKFNKKVSGKTLSFKDKSSYSSRSSRSSTEKDILILPSKLGFAPLVVETNLFENKRNTVTLEKTFSETSITGPVLETQQKEKPEKPVSKSDQSENNVTVSEGSVECQKSFSNESKEKNNELIEKVNESNLENPSDKIEEIVKLSLKKKTSSNDSIVNLSQKCDAIISPQEKINNEDRIDQAKQTSDSRFNLSQTVNEKIQNLKPTLKNEMKDFQDNYKAELLKFDDFNLFKSYIQTVENVELIDKISENLLQQYDQQPLIIQKPERLNRKIKKHSSEPLVSKKNNTKDKMDGQTKNKLEIIEEVQEPSLNTKNKKIHIIQDTTLKVRRQPLKINVPVDDTEIKIDSENISLENDLSQKKLKQNIEQTDKKTLKDNFKNNKIKQGKIFDDEDWVPEKEPHIEMENINNNTLVELPVLKEQKSNENNEQNKIYSYKSDQEKPTEIIVYNINSSDSEEEIKSKSISTQKANKKIKLNNNFTKNKSQNNLSDKTEKMSRESNIFIDKIESVDDLLVANRTSNTKFTKAIVHTNEEDQSLNKISLSNKNKTLYDFDAILPADETIKNDSPNISPLKELTNNLSPDNSKIIPNKPKKISYDLSAILNYKQETKNKGNDSFEEIVSTYSKKSKLEQSFTSSKRRKLFNADDDIDNSFLQQTMAVDILPDASPFKKSNRKRKSRKEPKMSKRTSRGRKSAMSTNRKKVANRLSAREKFLALCFDEADFNKLKGASRERFSKTNNVEKCDINIIDFCRQMRKAFGSLENLVLPRYLKCFQYLKKKLKMLEIKLVK